MQTDLFPEPPSQHLMVVDGNNAVHRIYHVPTAYSAKDRFGFMIRKILKSTSNSHAVIVWDPDDHGSCWRRKLHPEYKADRPERPPDLEELFVEARAICIAEGIAQAQAVDDEADDVAAAYVMAGIEAKLDVTIVTNDKDMLQLVGNFGSSKVRTQRKTLWGPTEVLEHYCVRPDQIVDYLALVGDTSDGYSGVPKIGAKTAVAMLKGYGSLEKILEHVHSDAVMGKPAKGKWAFGPGMSKSNVARLLEHEALAKTCKQLATLRRDVALPIPLEQTRINRP